MPMHAFILSGTDSLSQRVILYVTFKLKDMFMVWKRMEQNEIPY